MNKQPLSVSASIIALAARAVVIERRPNEYRINYRGGSDQTALYAEDLAGAVNLGWQLAAERPEIPPPPARPRRINRRAMIRRHNLKWSARAARQRAKQRAEAERRALTSLSFPDDC